MKRWKLTIAVLEDLHIGTGTGRGDIDAAQVRDRRGWLLLPASHIKGVLREAAIEWQRIEPSVLTAERIDRLFGRSGNRQGLLQLTSGYMGAERPTHIWGSTQIDASTGSAQEDSLRFIEYIPAGTQFEMQLALAHDSDDEDERMLRAIISRCRQLGGGRNRGHGRVRWQLSENPEVITQSLRVPGTFPTRLRLILRNLEPVCLARTGHPGNLIATESFVRGRSLRGALTAACLGLGLSNWAQRLLDPKLAWGDALPLPATADSSHPDEVATFEVLPITLSVGTPKATAPAGDLPWWVNIGNNPVFGARGEIDQMSLGDNELPAVKLKRPAADEFLFRPGPDRDWQRYRPQILERLHTRVPSQENKYIQDLFSTEEIAENTSFLADLIVTSPAQAEALAQALHALGPNWLRSGRGGRPLIVEHAKWLPMPAPTAVTGEGFILLLESDLIVRDDRGNFLDRLDARTVAALAGLPNAQIDADKSFSEGSDLFGFNAATGLPRLAQRAIKAGSAIRIKGYDAEQVRQALAIRLALGECPDEGFGRFRIGGLPVPSQPATTFASVSAAPCREESLCREAREYVERFGKALARPSASQWGDFRGRIQAAHNHAEIEAVFTLIDAAAKKLGGKAWEPFVSHNANGVLRTRVGNLPCPDAQRLLDDFVRWARAQNDSQESAR